MLSSEEGEDGGEGSAVVLTRPLSGTSGQIAAIGYTSPLQVSLQLPFASSF